MKLTSDAVNRLLADTTVEARADTAADIAAAYGEGLNDGERQVAEEIFRLMMQDAEVRVRQALSESLKDNPIVPRDVALTLAADVADVALPILEYSSVLNDDDLVEIIRSQSADHQKAIAQRATVSEPVSSALVETRDEDVVAELVRNVGAEIGEQAFEQVVDQFGGKAQIDDGLVRRSKLPLAVAERLVLLISNELRTELVSRHELADDTAADLVLEAREMATVGLIDDGSDRMDVLSLVRQLHENGRLSASIILRAACMGDMNFVEAALAARCGIPTANAYQLVHDKSGLGLKALAGRAGLEGELLLLLQTAVAVSNESDYDGRSGDRARFVESVIARILTSVEDEVDAANLDYLLEKLKRYTGVSPRASKP